MHGSDFSFMSGAPTKFYRPASLEGEGTSTDDTYRGPGPSEMGEAFRRLMWAVDGFRSAFESRVRAYREEEPELRRLDGVMIWLASSVMTAISLLAGLHLIGS